MDPNMFGTNAQWVALFKTVVLIVIVLIVGAFALGAWVF